MQFGGVEGEGVEAHHDRAPAEDQNQGLGQVLQPEHVQRGQVVLPSVIHLHGQEIKRELLQQTQVVYSFTMLDTHFVENVFDNFFVFLPQLFSVGFCNLLENGFCFLLLVVAGQPSRGFRDKEESGQCQAADQACPQVHVGPMTVQVDQQAEDVGIDRDVWKKN